MDELDRLYLWLLQVGFVVTKDAAFQNDSPWLAAELEFLHNVPSLVGETNAHRHQYFWCGERTTYLAWIQRFGSDRAKARKATFYDPILAEMALIFQSRFGIDESE